MTTESLMLLIDNDRRELGEILDLARISLDSRNLAKMMKSRYTHKLKNIIFKYMIKNQISPFNTSLANAMTSVLHSVDWNDIAHYYISKVNEGTTV